MRHHAASGPITINARHKCLRAILHTAVEDGIFPKNPAASSRLMHPGIDAIGIHALTRSDYRALLENLLLLKSARFCAKARLFCTPVISILLFTDNRLFYAMPNEAMRNTK